MDGEIVDGTNANGSDDLGLRADHVPVKNMDMNGVWIDRGNEGQDYEKLKDEVAYAWKFSTLGEMADAVEKAFEAEGQRVGALTYCSNMQMQIITSVFWNALNE
ncbi:hypothetical protein OCU04_010108 [Sclerotinia nivalis]|uniref:Uncharacterized protein n=1 Tax=Sclerotinia nivalis TaxID=352851 RepID=A0A9X0AE03_9HELO|nr:hypothetical protein OCU04_010108 [Sclerotinia nivalis]